MTETLVRQKIARFLQGTLEEVLCLRGKWGIGKTHLWDESVKAARTANAIGLNSYSCVTLYGVSTVDQLKLAIVMSTLPKEQAGQTINLKSARSAIESARARLRMLLVSTGGLVARYGHFDFIKELGKHTVEASFLVVNSQLVCLDDLERRGSSLPITEVLGLVNFLRDQRKCRIAVILNDGALTEADQEMFNNFFEKTVDSHVLYQSSPETAARIGLSKTPELANLLQPRCVALGIQNIRIIQRIARTAEQIMQIAAGFHAGVHSDCLRDVAVLTWSRYCEGAVPIGFLKGRAGYKHLLEAMTGKTVDPLKAEHDAILDRYGFRGFSNLSAALLDGIESGFFDKQRLMPILEDLDRTHKRGAADADMHEAWAIVSRSFGDDEETVASSLINQFRKNISFINPLNANGAIKLLRSIGRPEQATALAKLYIDSNPADVFHRGNFFSDRDIDDDELRNLISAKLGAVVDARPPQGGSSQNLQFWLRS